MLNRVDLWMLVSLMFYRFLAELVVLNLTLQVSAFLRLTKVATEKVENVWLWERRSIKLLAVTKAGNAGIYISIRDLTGLFIAGGMNCTS